MKQSTIVSYFRIGTVVVSMLLFFGCRPQIPDRAKAAPPAEIAEGEPLAAQPEASPIFAVNTTRAVAGELIDYLELNGDVLPRSTVDIFPETIGKVARLMISVGDRIEKDQVIAEIDPSRPGMIFVPSPVRSPIAGTVSLIPVHIGSTVTQGMPIARVTTTENLEIRTEVAERFIGRMRTGLEVLVAFVAFPGEIFRGRVTELSPLVDPISRTMEIKIVLTRQDPRIRPGMFAELKIITERKWGVVKIPVDGLVRRFGENFMFVVKEDTSVPTGKRVERRQVTVGIQVDEKLEILRGIQPNDEIVVMGQTLLEDNSIVRVVGEIPPLPIADSIDW